MDIYTVMKVCSPDQPKQFGNNDKINDNDNKKRSWRL